ncbi:hypothetical protein MKW92_029909 [Papaver armeniacum]|nr:hypothetical protein MKW92_029909 [Papaver armeniacum]
MKELFKNIMEGYGDKVIPFLSDLITITTTKTSPTEMLKERRIKMDEKHSVLRSLLPNLKYKKNHRRRRRRRRRRKNYLKPQQIHSNSIVDGVRFKVSNIFGIQLKMKIIRLRVSVLINEAGGGGIEEIKKGINRLFV